MIADIRFWEQKASEGHYAIPHFNVWNAEMLMGVMMQQKSFVLRSSFPSEQDLQEIHLLKITVI